MEPATPAMAHWRSCESLPVPVDEFDHGSAAPDLRHVTTPGLKATFYPPARPVLPRRRERNRLSVVDKDGRGPPLPIHKAIEKETAASGPTATFHFLGSSRYVSFL